MEPQKNQFNQVTTLSKILAALLFIVLPFVGLYIGYTFAPEKVVEVERVVEIERIVPKAITVEEQQRLESKTQAAVDEAVRPFGQILSEGIIRESAGDHVGKYLWTSDQVFFLSTFANFYSLHLLEEIPASQAATSHIRTEQIGVEGAGLQAEIVLLISDEKVYHRDSLLVGLDATEMQVNRKNGYLADSDSVFEVGVRCEGVIVTEVESVDLNRVFTGC